MSEITLNVLDAARAVHTRIHASRVDYLVAALSADPETIEELEIALGRFLPGESEGFFRHWRRGTCEEPWDAGLCIIDLAARLVATESTYSSPGPRGEVEYRGPHAHEREIGLSYHLAEDWRFEYHVEGTRGLAEERRRARAAAPPFDARPVLYGKVCEFIARECQTRTADEATVVEAACARPVSQPAEASETEQARQLAAEDAETERTCEAIRDIHARWLLTPRDDLRGQAPRDVLLAGKEHITWELQYRSEQWSMLRRPPPALPRDSAAYRFAGFGTHEIVIYYDLVRQLLGDCWNRVVKQRRLADAEAIAAEARRLEAVRDEWLQSRNFEDLSGQTPAHVIEQERIRMPMAMSAQEAVIDDDCPVCRMMAEDPDMGPMFWNLDGCNMDDDFAFSFHRTHEEWEAEQREYEEWNRRFDEEQKQKHAELEANSVWKRSFGVADTTEPQYAGPELVLLGIGMHLAELTQDIKDAAGSPGIIDGLNRDFGNLREAAADPSAALVEPVVESFVETLHTVSDDRAELSEKCSDLERQLRLLARKLTDEPLPQEDLPF
jgi:hypothetical protein